MLAGMLAAALTITIPPFYVTEGDTFRMPDGERIRVSNIKYGDMIRIHSPFQSRIWGHEGRPLPSAAMAQQKGMASTNCP